MGPGDISVFRFTLIPNCNRKRLCKTLWPFRLICVALGHSEPCHEFLPNLFRQLQRRVRRAKTPKVPIHEHASRLKVVADPYRLIPFASSQDTFQKRLYGALHIRSGPALKLPLGSVDNEGHS